jgi:hypothetical protein
VGVHGAGLRSIGVSASRDTKDASATWPGTVAQAVSMYPNLPMALGSEGYRDAVEAGGLRATGPGEGARSRDIQLGRPERVGALAPSLGGERSVSSYRVVKDTVRREIGLAQKAA